MTAVLQPQPSPAPAARWRFPAVERSELPGGMRLALCHLPGQAVVEVRLVIDGGARSDPAGLEGLSAIVGRALVESTERLEVDGFAVAVESLGARIGSELHWDALVPGASCPRSRLGELFALLAEVVTTPGFREADVARVVRARVDEATRARRFPNARVGMAFAATAYAPGSRRAVSAAGSPESVGAITVDDVRAHWARLARPDASTLVVVGDLDGLDVAGMATEAFASWAAGPAPGDPPRPVEIASVGAARVVDLPDAVQTELAVGHVIPTVDLDERPALRVAVHAVGGHFNSLLNAELREHRGVTYGVRASVDHAGGSTQLVVGTAVQSDATADSVAEIVRQLRAATAGIDAEAIAHAVENLVRTGPTSYRSGAAVMSAVVRNTIEDLPDDHDDRMRDAIATTTPEQAAAALAAAVGEAPLVVTAVGSAASMVDGLREATGLEPAVEPI